MDESTKAQEGLWNGRYTSTKEMFGGEPNFFLKEKKDYISKFTKALCVADGQGRNGVWIAKLGLDVTNYDVSEVGVQDSQKYASEQGVSERYHAIVGDIMVDSLESDQFDLIVVSFCQFTAKWKLLHEKLRRTLKSGGSIIIIGYTPKQLEFKTGGPSWVENLYTFDDLCKDFAEFNVIEGKDLEIFMHEGERHKGTSAICVFVAEKK